MVISWDGFKDVHTDIIKYEWCVDLCTKQSCGEFKVVQGNGASIELGEANYEFESKMVAEKWYCATGEWAIEYVGACMSARSDFQSAKQSADQITILPHDHRATYHTITYHIHHPRCALRIGSLTHAHTYLLTHPPTNAVRATNAAGFTSTKTSEKAQYIGTLPKPGIVSDGNDPNRDLSFQRHTTQLSACWSGFHPESENFKAQPSCLIVVFFHASSRGVHICCCLLFSAYCVAHTNVFHVSYKQVTFRQDSESGQIVATSPLLGSTERCTTQRDLTLQNGRMYIATVETTYLSVPVAAASNGITVDTVSPAAGNLAWGAACSDIRFFRSTTANLQLCWHGFSDASRLSGAITPMTHL